jgi:4-amino-4-deoxy-L-arabinose transferase-like glycosyltransferase
MPRKCFDSLFLGTLILYLLAGVVSVPFHGDESTIVFMSHDWDTLLHSPGRLGYSVPPTAPGGPAAQELRLLNGPLAGYGIGLLWTITGFQVSQVNDQWLWGTDWNYNQTSGHIPSPALLFVARLSSAFATAISIAAVFAIAARLGGVWAARLASLIYTFTPEVLLNGRRAMFEGVFFMGSALLLLVGVWLAARIMRGRDRPRDWLLIGLIGGIALTAKHTAILFIVPIFGFLALCALYQRYVRRATLRAMPLLIFNILGAGVVTLLFFLTLNPAWWTTPIDRVPREVLRLRSDLLKGQVTFYGGYSDLSAQIVGLSHALFGAPQYYEDSKGWPEWIGGQITAYETSGLAGIPGITILAGLLALAGIVFALRSMRSVPIRLFLVSALFLYGATFALTPLLWVRYYLPLFAPLSILAGLSVGWLRGHNA